MDAFDFRLALSIISVVLNAGLFGLLFKLNVEWAQVRERIDILYRAYCIEHNIPFRPLYKKYEGD